MKHAFGVRFVKSHLWGDTAQIQLPLAHAVPIQSRVPGLGYHIGLTESILLESLELTQERIIRALCIADIWRLQGLLQWLIQQRIQTALEIQKDEKQWGKNRHRSSAFPDCKSWEGRAFQETRLDHINEPWRDQPAEGRVRKSGPS